MSRVVMFVLNDVTKDSRVLREAGSLARARHDVTVVGLLPANSLLPERERRRDGFEIMRIPYPTSHEWWRPRLNYFQTLRKRAVGVYPRTSYRLRRAARIGLGRLRHARGAAAAVPSRLTATGARVRPRSLLRAGTAIPSLVLSGGVTVVFVSWAVVYLIVNRVTGGHLDWALRIRYRWERWSRLASEAVGSADVWHGHDMAALRAAVLAQKRSGGKLVYDSHEILLESGSYVKRPRPIRAILRRLEASWIRRTDAVVTVNEMLGVELAARYKPRRVVVTHNCAPRPAEAPPPERDLIREAAGIDPATPIAVYHGGLTVHRGIEQMLDALLQPGLEAVHGVLLGYGPLWDTFKAMAMDARFGGRIHLLPAVAPDELVEWLASADVAVMPIQPTTLNHRLCTPNKLFEAIAAGVPVVGSDFVGLRRVVRDNPGGSLGELCDPRDVKEIALAIRRVIERSPLQRSRVRSRCLRAARTMWNWEIEERKLLNLYDDLLGVSARTAATRRARMEIAS